MANDVDPSIKTRRPSDSVMSTLLAERAALDVTAVSGATAQSAGAKKNRLLADLPRLVLRPAPPFLSHTHKEPPSVHEDKPTLRSPN